MEARVVQLRDPALLHAQGQKKSRVQRNVQTPRLAMNALGVLNCKLFSGVGWCWGITTVPGVQVVLKAWMKEDIDCQSLGEILFQMSVNHCSEAVQQRVHWL